MFSMSALASSNLDATALARLGVLQGTEALLPKRSVLPLGWPELERALPDRGLPCGVIEIAAMPRLLPHRSHSRWASTAGVPESMRGGATSIAIAAVSALQASDEKAWSAWITPSHVKGRIAPFLYAPALARAGVDLERLLVVRPPPQALARTVVKVAASGAFGLLVIDTPHPQDLCGGAPRRGAGSARRSSTRFEGRNDGGAMVVRKLALAAEESGTTSLLLTSALASRALPWPVALRIEVERRPSSLEDSLAIRVTKDRRGAASSQHVVRLAG
jgi:recombination protein RecA